MKFSSLASLLALAGLALSAPTAHAQVSYTGVAVTQDFSSYRGLGIAPGGSGGALDSSAWFVDATSATCALGATCPLVAPPTVPTGPFYGGPSSGGVSAVSLYSFDTGGPGGSNPSLGVQVGTSTYVLTAAYRNDSGAALNALVASYTFGERNDQAGQVGVRVSLDPDGPGAAAPVALGALSEQSTAAVSGVPTWELRPHFVIADLSATPIAAGARFNLIFTVAYFSGSTGGRDEVSIDDVEISAAPVVGSCGDGTVQTGEQCDGGPLGSDCCSASCTFAARGAACGSAPSSVCDAQDTCDGGGACIVNYASSRVVCRARVSGCDVSELCTGVSTVCPVDLLQPSTAVCRAASGPCDLAETCTGSSPICPSNVLAPNGTSCSNGMVCDGSELCMTGTCRPGTALSCDDGDVCTADMCAEPGGCRAAAIAGCCVDVADCDDGDVCTADSCSGVGGMCGNSPVTGCCTSNADCDDGNVCTTNACDLSTNTCVAMAVPDCCSTATDCDDGNVCTADTCDSAGSCGNATIADCCVTDGDCDDGDDCTIDTCSSTNACDSAPIPGCGIDGGMLEPDGGVLETDGGVVETDGGVVEIDGGVVETDGGVIEIDGGVGTDSGVPGSDAGRRDGGASDASVTDSGIGLIDAGGPGVAGGCGCRASGSTGGAGGLGLLALLALALGYRRR